MFLKIKVDQDPIYRAATERAIRVILHYRHRLLGRPAGPTLGRCEKCGLGPVLGFRGSPDSIEGECPDCGARKVLRPMKMQRKRRG